MTFTTREAFAGGFRFAALALSARDRTAKFVGGLDESLVAAEVLATGLLGTALVPSTVSTATATCRDLHIAKRTHVILASGLLPTTLRLRTLSSSTTSRGRFNEAFATLKLLARGLLGATLRLVTLRASATNGGCFNEAFAAFEFLTRGLWSRSSSGRSSCSRLDNRSRCGRRQRGQRLAALLLCTFGLSTAFPPCVFQETLATLKVRADCFFRAALTLLALSLATRFLGGPQETSSTLVRVARCLLLTAFLI
jgi:hypothetical protein